MPTKVVSFREDEEALQYLRDQGLNPSEVAKEAFEREVRRIRALAAMERLQKRAITLGEPAEDIIRSMRDA